MPIQKVDTVVNGSRIATVCRHLDDKMIVVIRQGNFGKHRESNISSSAHIEKNVHHYDADNTVDSIL